MKRVTNKRGPLNNKMPQNKMLLNKMLLLNKKGLLLLAGLLLAAFIFVSLADEAAEPAEPAEPAFDTRGLELAQCAPNREAQLIKHTGYTTCYNSKWLIPNWVAYDLTPRELVVATSRPNRQFEPDPLVRGRSARHSDYTKSGYSRGHMAPAADMRWSERAMNESFYLSNICPQRASLNGGVWKRIEERCRALAEESTVYICCGPIVQSGYKKIGKNRVAVPSGFFKVLCMKRKGKWQAIGFIVPNADNKRWGSMFNYAYSVDEVEARTGHNFFYNLPDAVERKIEASFSTKNWQ